MPLSEIVIRQAKPGPKAIKIFDGRGLYLLLSPNGSRGWRFKYRVDGREKLISFGIYPDVPLKLARDRREEARQQLAAGIDPGAKRKAEKVAQGDTFEAIAREWLALQEPKLAPATFAKGDLLRPLIHKSSDRAGKRRLRLWLRSQGSAQNTKIHTP